mgnify:CR=1 FL=1
MHGFIAYLTVLILNLFDWRCGDRFASRRRCGGLARHVRLLPVAIAKLLIALSRGRSNIVFLIVLAGIWGATQWTAAALAYQPELGPPWFVTFGWRIYPPPAFFWWWFSFDAYAPSIFLEGAAIAVSGGLVSIVVAITLSVLRAREAKNVVTYGSARWAGPRLIASFSACAMATASLGGTSQPSLTASSRS